MARLHGDSCQLPLQCKENRLILITFYTNKFYFHLYHAMKIKKEKAESLRSCEVIVICGTMC